MRHYLCHVKFNEWDKQTYSYRAAFKDEDNTMKDMNYAVVRVPNGDLKLVKIITKREITLNEYNQLNWKDVVALITDYEFNEMDNRLTVAPMW